MQNRFDGKRVEGNTEEESLIEYFDSEEEIGDADESTDTVDFWGCLFPGKCMMPGEHLVSECCTAEMMEQGERKA
jgi:hypothetical protein